MTATRRQFVLRKAGNVIDVGHVVAENDRDALAAVLAGRTLCGAGWTVKVGAITAALDEADVGKIVGQIGAHSTEDSGGWHGDGAARDAADKLAATPISVPPERGFYINLKGVLVPSHALEQALKALQAPVESITHAEIEVDTLSLIVTYKFSATLGLMSKYVRISVYTPASAGWPVQSIP